MKSILEDYIDICMKFRPDGLSKTERKHRHILLTEWVKTVYADSELTVAELYSFWDKYQSICWNKLFFKKVIVPTVQTNFDSDSIEGIKFLCYCLRGKEMGDYLSIDSPLRIFCDAIGNNYTPYSLVSLILYKEPNNEDALRAKYYFIRCDLEYSIHEVPRGVLFFDEDISSMLRVVDDFEELSKNLKIFDDTLLIQDCRRYYTAYDAYLIKRVEYVDFEDYLIKNSNEG